MTAIELEGFIHIDREIDLIKNEISELAHWRKIMKNSLSEDKARECAEQIEQLEKSLTKNLKCALAKRKSLAELINGISNDRTRLIFRLRLVGGKTWKEIGEITGYIYEGARRLYMKAVGELG